VIDDNDP